MLRHRSNISCCDVFQFHSSWTESDNAESAGQAANRIVLRLARDTGTTSTESWQVLSLSDYEFDPRGRTGKKPKLSLTIYKRGKAGKQRSKRKGKYKIKNVTDSASVLNKVTVPECGASNDTESQISEDSKHTNVLAADCRNICSVSNARSSGTVSRKSRTARLFNKDSHSLKENFFDQKCHDAKDDANINARDNAGDNMGDKDNLSAVYSNKVNCTTAIPKVSKTRLTNEEDSHRGVNSCQESVHNGMFSLAADSVKIRKRRKVVPNSRSRKRCSTAKDEDNGTEAGETVDVASAFESDKLNNNAACNSILLSRRARPVKNRALMNNCYVFTELVKTRQRRRISGKKPAAETIVNAEYSEAGSSQLENKMGVDNVTNHTMVDSDKLNCHVPNSKEASCDESSTAVEYTEWGSASNLHVLDLLDDSIETALWNQINRSSCMLKPNPDILNTVSDTTHIPHEGNDAEVANAEETFCTEADDCECVKCDRVANRDSTTVVTNSPPVHSYVKDEPVNDCQFLSLAENTRCDFSHLIKNDDIKRDDIKVAEEPGETLQTLSIPITEVKGGVSDSDATKIQLTDNEIHNLSTEHSDGTCVPDPNKKAVDTLGCSVTAVDHSNAEADEPAEYHCLLPANADDVEICDDVLENCTELVPVDLVAVECNVTQFVKDDTDLAVASNGFDNDGDTKSLPESACDEIIEAFVTNKEEVTNEPGSCLLPLKPDFATAYDVELSKNVSENIKISDALLASGLSVTTAECHHLHCDAITSMDTNSLNVNQSTGIELPTVSSITSPESSLPVEETAGHRPRRNAPRNVRSRWKSVGAKVEDLGHNYAKSSDGITSPESSLPTEETAGHRRRRNVRRNVRSRRKSAGARIEEDLGHNYAKRSADLLNCREKRKQLTDVEFRKNASEIIKISDASVPSGSNETTSEYWQLHSDGITSTDTNGLIVNQSTGIELPAVSSVTSPEFSLPVEQTAGQRRRRNAPRNVKSRRKSVGARIDEDLGHNYAERSADSLNCTEKRKQQTDLQLSKNVSEIIKISDASVASGLSVSTGECHHFHCDAITSTDTDCLVVNQSAGVELPTVSSVTSPESILPVKGTAGDRHRRNAPRNIRSQRKSVGAIIEEDLGHAKSSVDSLTCIEKHEQLTVDRSTDKLRRVRRKTSECDSVEEIPGAEVKTVSSTAAGKKQHSASLRLLLLSTIFFIINTSQDERL